MWSSGPDLIHLILKFYRCIQPLVYCSLFKVINGFWCLGLSPLLVNLILQDQTNEGEGYMGNTMHGSMHGYSAWLDTVNGGIHG